MKKIICAILALILLVSVPVLCFSENKAETLQEIGILKGTEKGLELERNVTRAEAVVFILRMLPESPYAAGTKPAFSDTGDHWANKDIAKAVLTGFVHGNEDGTFEPERNVTAQEFAKMYLCAIGYNATPETALELGEKSGWLNDDETKEIVKNNKTLIRDDVVTLLYAGLQQDESGAYAFADKLNAFMPKNENYVFSPYSIRMAFSLAANGASGDTKDEILNVMGMQADADNVLHAKCMSDYANDTNFTLETANAAWYNTDEYPDLPFLPAYTDTIKSFYNAEVLKTDSANAIKDINGWVNEKTHGKIPQILEDNQFAVALVNAVYMNAKWKLPFEERSTFEETFYALDGTAQQVDFMHQTAHFNFAEKDGVQVLELPYRASTDISMYILMGDNGIENPLQMIQSTKLQNQHIKLALPKFEVDFKPDSFPDTLKTMGIRDAFDRDNTDFSNMTGKKELFISNVLHKAYLKVDEEGTEAAAATVIEMPKATAARPTDILEVTIDKPFTFVVLDKTNNMPLFVGKISNFPEAEIFVDEFCYAEVKAEGEPGVVTDGFLNTTPQPIETAKQAIERAKNECQVEYDRISVAFDADAQMWEIVFWKYMYLGDDHTIYLDSNGITHKWIFGE